jgi:hypothetical protein
VSGLSTSARNRWDVELGDLGEGVRREKERFELAGRVQNGTCAYKAALKLYKPVDRAIFEETTSREGQ